MFASPAAVTLHTINIPEIFRKFTVFLVSVCVTVNKEHWSQYFLALNWCNRTSTTGCSVGGYLTKFLTGMLRPEVQPLTLLYREYPWGFSLQRHLGINGFYTTRNVGRLILIYQTGTNTTHQTSRAVRAVHKTSVPGTGEVISHLPISPSLFPHPSPPPPRHTHSWSCNARKMVWLWLKLQTQ